MWDEDASRMEPTPARDRLGVMDVWYVDDAYVRADLMDGDLWLAAGAMVAVAAGMRRNAQKSHFLAAADGSPAPPYSSITCSRRLAADPARYLGVDLHGQDEQFRQGVGVTATVHKALRDLENPALELLLMRQYAS